MVKSGWANYNRRIVFEKPGSTPSSEIGCWKLHEARTLAFDRTGVRKKLKFGLAECGKTNSDMLKWCLIAFISTIWLLTLYRLFPFFRGVRFLWDGRLWRRSSTASLLPLVTFGAMVWYCGRSCHSVSGPTGTGAIMRWVRTQDNQR